MKKLLLIPLLLIGCISAPDRDDFDLQDCFDEATCNYQDARSDTKIDCSGPKVRCNNARTEKRMLDRYQYCGKPENRWKNKDAQSCWDKLNSK